MMPRDGTRGANQFQDYLEGLNGEGRSTSDRAGIGVPYYRSAVDPNFGPRGTNLRQYQPNANSSARFERAQRTVADKYLAYFSERDPARRAELMKEYGEARREAARVITGGTRSPSRILDSSTRLDAGSRRATGSGPGSARPPTTNRPGAREDRFGPAPAVPPVGSARSSGSARSRVVPEDVLNRSRAMDLDDGLLPRSRPSTARPRRSGLDLDDGLLPRSRPSTTARPRRSTQPATAPMPGETGPP
jgi:hypothetical protein